MDELIHKVATKTGLDEAIARQAIGAIFAFLKAQSSERFDIEGKVLSKIDGSEGLIQEAEEAQEERRREKAAKKEGTSAEGGAPSSEEGENAVAVQSSGGILGLVKGTVGLFITLLRIFGVLALIRGILEKILGEQMVARIVDKVEGVIESVEDGAELTSVIRDLGITKEQGIRMLRLVVDWMKEKVGGDTIDDLVEKIPAVKLLLGESKKED